MSRRGCSSPANASGFDPHRSITSRFGQVSTHRSLARQGKMHQKPWRQPAIQQPQPPPPPPPQPQRQRQRQGAGRGAAERRRAFHHPAPAGGGGGGGGARSVRSRRRLSPIRLNASVHGGGGGAAAGKKMGGRPSRRGGGGGGGAGGGPRRRRQSPARQANVAERRRVRGRGGGRGGGGGQFGSLNKTADLGAMGRHHQPGLDSRGKASSAPAAARERMYHPRGIRSAIGFLNLTEICLRL
jgi:hypothetical protein